MSENRSRHPVDLLICELIAGQRQAKPDDIAHIIERIATAPFEPRARRVPLRERGIAYAGRALGAREASLFYHLVKRVRIERQWAVGTSMEEYLADLRAAVRHPLARLALYRERGGHLAATSTPTVEVVPAARRGARPRDWLLVIYSADRGIMISGYQYSSLSTARIPGEAQWLK